MQQRRRPLDARTAISTGGGRLEDGVALAAHLGLEWVELACQHPVNHPGALDTARREAVREQLQDSGISGVLHTSSAVNVAETVPVVARAVREAHLTQFDLAVDLGARVVVVHAGYGFDETPAGPRAATTMLRSLAEAAGDRGLTLALENMNVLPPAAEIRYLGCTVEQVGDLLAAVDSPALGACADLGHAHLLPEGAVGYLRAFAGSVTHVQLTDNDGVLDHHLTLGDGTLPLPEVLAELAAGPYDGPFAVELDDAAAARASVAVLRELRP